MESDLEDGFMRWNERLEMRGSRLWNLPCLHLPRRTGDVGHPRFVGKGRFEMWATRQADDCMVSAVRLPKAS